MAGVYGNMMAIPRNGRGGALPEYQGDGRVYTPGAGVSARLSDSAAGIYRQTAAQTGQGLRDLARGIDTANRIGMAAYEDYNKTKATQLMVEYRTRVNDAMYGDNGLMTRKGEDAFQADRELERRSQQIREEVLKDYRGSLAENLFNMRVREFDAGNLLRAKKHKRDEYDAWSNRADDAAADMFATEAAANYGSPEAYSSGAAQAAWHVRQMLERKGYPPEAIAQALKQTQKSIYDKAMKQAISLGDFDGAERLLGGTAASLPTDVAELAKREAKAQGMDPDLVMGVIAQESGGRHGVVSSAGARGLMQLMPGTARDLGVNPDDPAQNVRAGVSYLKQMLQRYNGNVEHALAAYNWGPGNVDAWLKTGKGVKGQAMPEETRKYVPGVLAKMGMDGGVSSVEKQAYRKQIDEGVYKQVNTFLGAGDYTAATNVLQQYGGRVSDPNIRSALDAKATSLVAMRDIQDTAGMSFLSRQEELYKRANSLPAGARRSEYLQLIGNELTFQKKKEDAEDGKMMVDAINFGTRNGWTAIQWEQNLAKMQGQGVRLEVISGIRKYLNGGEKKLSAAKKQEQERTVSDVKREFDQYYEQYGVVNPDTEKLDQLFKKGEITFKQYNDLVEYRDRGGAYRNLSQSSLDSIYKKVTGKKGRCPQNLVKAAWSRFGKEQGRVVTDDELERWMAQAYSAEAIVERGDYWDTTKDLDDAMAEGKTVVGIVVPKSALSQVKALMKAQGATEEQINNTEYQEKTYAKMIMGKL